MARTFDLRIAFYLSCLDPNKRLEYLLTDEYILDSKGKEIIFKHKDELPEKKHDSFKTFVMLSINDSITC